MKRINFLTAIFAAALLSVALPAIASAQYGQYGQNAQRQAEQYGYQDGVNDGRNDRSTGHSFRPTEDDSYRRGTNGYSDQSGISKDQYKQWYRSAYQQGYQQGYGNSNGRRY